MAPDTLYESLPALPPTYYAGTVQERGGSPAPASADSFSETAGAPMNTAQARPEEDQASKGYNQQIMNMPELLAPGRGE